LPRVLYPDNDGSMHLPYILNAYILEPSDIAVFTIIIPETLPSDLTFSKKLQIDSGPPKTGNEDKALGYWGMTTSREDHGIDIHCSLAFREGTIGQVFPIHGPPNKPWPCFHCTTPFDSGMSGGPIVDTSGETDVVIGMVCSDFTLGESLEGSGPTAISSILWPSMMTKMKNEHLHGIDGPTLIDFVRRGLINDRGMAHDHIQVTQTDPEQMFMKWV